MPAKLLIILLFALIVAVFSIQNAGLVSITILTWQYEISLAYIILGAVALGVIIMGVFSSLRQLRLKRKLRSARAENVQLEEINRVLEERINNLTAVKRDNFSKAGGEGRTNNRLPGSEMNGNGERVGEDN